jgi:hypothetical protein
MKLLKVQAFSQAYSNLDVFEHRTESLANFSISSPSYTTTNNTNHKLKIMTIEARYFGPGFDMSATPWLR